MRSFRASSGTISAAPLVIKSSWSSSDGNLDIFSDGESGISLKYKDQNERRSDPVYRESRFSRNSRWQGRNSNSKSFRMCVKMCFTSTDTSSREAKDGTLDPALLNPDNLAVLYYFGDLQYWKLP